MLRIRTGLTGLAALAVVCGPACADWYMVEVKSPSSPNVHTGGPEGKEGVKWGYDTAGHDAYVTQDAQTGVWWAACLFYNSEAWGSNPGSAPGPHGWCGLEEDSENPGTYLGAWAVVEFRTEYEGGDPPDAEVDVELCWDFSAYAELAGSWAGGQGLIKADVEYPGGGSDREEEHPYVLATVYEGQDPPEDYDEDNDQGESTWGAEEGAVFTGQVRQLQEAAASSDVTGSSARAEVDTCEIHFELVEQ